MAEIEEEKVDIFVDGYKDIHDKILDISEDEIMHGSLLR
jgi:hypothetical protein